MVANFVVSTVGECNVQSTVNSQEEKEKMPQPAAGPNRKGQILKPLTPANQAFFRTLKF
jgi:hypothetical protein